MNLWIDVVLICAFLTVCLAIFGVVVSKRYERENRAAERLRDYIEQRDREGWK